MNEITRKLGLQYVLKDEAIELQPMPALRAWAGERPSRNCNRSTP